MISFATATHIGLVRETQEDAFGHFEDKFFVIADGLGGHVGGEIASKIAVEESLKVLKWSSITLNNSTVNKLLNEIFRQANRKIIEFVQRDPTLLGMGTTLVTLLVNNNNWWVGNVGDSRAYLYSHKTLNQITIDHEEPSGVLTRAVGLEADPTPDIFSGEARIGDIIILTTDGLTDFVSDKKIQQVLHIKNDIKTKANNLIKLALETGGLDNITVVLVQFGS